jgi:hypothetical protein
MPVSPKLLGAHPLALSAGPEAARGKNSEGVGGHVAANSGRKTNWCQRSYDAKGELAANPRAQSGIGRFTFTEKVAGQVGGHIDFSVLRKTACHQ